MRGTYLFILSSFFYFIEPHKILVFSPSASKSHVISQGRIAEELAKAGHDVVNFEPDFLDISEKIKPCNSCRRWILTGLNNRKYKEIQNEISENIFDPQSFFGILFNSKTDPHQDEYTNLCEEIVTNSTLIDQLKAEKFDAYFGEHVHLCGMGLAHILQIPHRFWIASCSMGVNMRSILGIPTPSSFLPFQADIDEAPAPVWQRAKNFILQQIQIRDERRDNSLTTQMFQTHYGKNFPDVESIARDSDIIFVSTDELIEIPSPTLPNVIHIGGLGTENRSNQKINKIFEDEMKKGKGVILFSLGTIANTTSIPQSVMRNVLKATQEFQDYHFIVKVDSENKNTFEAAKDLRNVFVADWVPQPDLLAHPNLKLFITHAGYNSIIEAARNGIPLITIPFMFDQPRNSRTVARKGWGIACDKNILAETSEQLVGAIKQILTEKTYQEKANRLKNLIKTKPQSASERLIKTTNWVLDNHGIEELQYEGKILDTITFYNLDIFALVIILIATVLISLRLSNYVGTKNIE